MDFLRFLRSAGSGFDWRLLGPALLVPLFETFRRVSFSLTDAAAEASSAGACVAWAVLGAAGAAACLMQASRMGRATSLRAKAAAGGTAAFLLAACTAILLSGPAGAGAFAGPGLFFSAGAGMTVLLVGWTQAYARVRRPVQASLAFGSSLVLGGLFLFWAIDADSGPLAVLLICCMAASCLLLSSFAKDADAPGMCAGTAVRGDEATARDAPTSGGDEPWALSDILRAAAEPTAIGLALCFFSEGVMSIPPEPYASSHSAVVLVLGFLIALAIMAAFLYILRDSFTFDAVRDRAFFLLPVFAVFLAYFSFVRMLEAHGMLKHVLSVGWNCCFGGFLSLFILLAALKVRDRGATPEQACAPGLLLCAALYAMGTGAHSILGDNAMYIQVVLSTLYILWLALSATGRASLNDEARLQRRVSELAHAAGLSARETEVLSLLAQDYSPDLIADRLCISVATVRTHRKRIYTKLQIHRHEELSRALKGRS